VIDFEVKPLNRAFKLIRIKPQMLIKMKEVVPDVYYVGVNDHLTKLFEGLWPIPEGVSYNSYIVKGEKTALIETVKIPFIDEFLKKVEEVTSFDIDYIILNHIEPDHSSSLPRLLEKVPNATIYCSKKAVGMLDSLYGITENIHAVEEG